MKKILLAPALALAIAAGNAEADGDFGTKEEARAIADAMIAIVDERGLEAAIAAMHDPAHPFVTSRMGVNLFQGSIVVADNREPETIAADYSEIADLTGVAAWSLIGPAAAVEGDANLRWYHYDTQEEYEFKCHAKRATEIDVSVMVCR